MVRDALLLQLKDIHYPSAIGVWPMAMGWWLLIFLMILAGVGLFYVLRWWRRYQFKQQFLQELQLIQAQYEKEACGQKALSQLALLLKRVALTYYPREQVASLYGQEWVAFLQSTGGKDEKDELKHLFSESLYQEEVLVDVKAALVIAQKWIKKQRAPCTN